MSKLLKKKTFQTRNIQWYIHPNFKLFNCYPGAPYPTSSSHKDRQKVSLQQQDRSLIVKPLTSSLHRKDYNGLWENCDGPNLRIQWSD